MTILWQGTQSCEGCGLDKPVGEFGLDVINNRRDPLCENCAGEKVWKDREAECVERGWFAKRAPIGWEPCEPDEEGAMPDFNRLIAFKADPSRED